jgi:hypothetical protein
VRCKEKGPVHNKEKEQKEKEHELYLFAAIFAAGKKSTMLSI